MLLSCRRRLKQDGPLHESRQASQRRFVTCVLEGGGQGATGGPRPCEGEGGYSWAETWSREPTDSYLCSLQLLGPVWMMPE